MPTADAMSAAATTTTTTTTTTAMPTNDAASDGGISSAIEALHHLKSAEPPSYLTPSAELSKSARIASQYLFSSIKPFAPKSPFSHLLTEGFDAEQIWQQIDLQSQPLLSSLRRQVRNFKSNPQEIEKLFNFESTNGNGDGNVDGDRYNSEDQLNKEFEGLESESDDFSGDDEEEDDEDEEEDGDDDDDEGKEDGDDANGVEDRFLKLNELEKYLEEDEAREYGLNKETDKNKKNNKRNRDDVVDEYGESDEDEEDKEDDDDDDDDELEVMGLDHSDEDGNAMGNARYEDFFGSKKTGQKKKSKQFDPSDDLDMNDIPDDDHVNQKKQSLSTHEKEQEKLRSEIEKMEKANLEPKTWRMQGEVTAAKRPKNSALEVDLDFEHNVRPAPVITEEVTVSLEELIQERVLEGLFDDVQKRPTLSNKAPREKIELNESKSKKGLAELYEDEYAQKTGLVSAALTFSDEQKKEASMLFKKLCLKLDALSHFHFTPKPIIEDMSIQTNVPALAMEEIAPLAVSDAAMLAPEEVFAGKGNIKEETELTKSDRKRRRSNKKRKFKAESVKREAIRAQQQSTLKKHNEEADVGQDDKKARYKRVKEKF